MLMTYENTSAETRLSSEIPSSGLTYRGRRTVRANFVDETLGEIIASHRAGRTRPNDTVERSYERIRAYADPAVFIALREEADALAEAKALAARDPSQLPLYGVPVAVKDNIDVAGLPTTAACPAYSYRPERDATAVARLRAAGAIVIGKTNLDQFATGLVGVRSPYGVPRNPHRADLIPGGSSSGSATAVAAGLVPLSLGTDTAGSGRVPAGLNNIVGLKPSLSLVPTSGVVPACRSLDCISVFALTTDDAFAALSVIAGRDDADSYSRTFRLPPLGEAPPVLRIAIPGPAERKFFGDTRSQAAFELAIGRCQKLGMTVTEIDFGPFLDAARLLYDGPWIAERFAAVGEFIAMHPGEAHPVTEQIVLAGAKPSAVDAFRAFYRLAELRAKAYVAMSSFDALMVPTVPAAYTVEQLLSDPVTLNSNLGTYTNFVNLFDMCGLSVPVTIADDRTPYGVTFLGSAGQDAFLAAIGRRFHAESHLTLGALGKAAPSSAGFAGGVAAGEIAIAVVGAHLSGMPLNGELKALGGRFIEATRTAKSYRLYALGDAGPRRPGMIRAAADGAAIDLEIWALPAEGFGRFVEKVPAPLSIGTINLADGRNVKGFLAEAAGVTNARDITSFGGWRQFVAKETTPA